MADRIKLDLKGSALHTLYHAIQHLRAASCDTDEDGTRYFDPDTGILEWKTAEGHLAFSMADFARPPAQYDYKFALLHLIQASELLMKSHLEKLSPGSIFLGSMGRRTIGMGECIERIARLYPNLLIPEQAGLLLRAKHLRNELEHFEFDTSAERMRTLCNDMLAICALFTLKFFGIRIAEAFSFDPWTDREDDTGTWITAALADVSEIGNPETQGGVQALAVDGPTVYLGGGFTRVAGVGKRHLAAVSDRVTPVEIVDLTAQQDGADVLLRWFTTLESDISAFRVFRAPVGGPFEALPTAIEPNAQRVYSFRDPAPTAGKYRYRIGEVNWTGAITLHGLAEVEVVHSVPRQTYLSAPVPNPGNPSTTLQFGVASEGSASLRIYDVRGRIVRTLMRHNQMDVRHERVIWDGLDDDGHAVASGVYTIVLHTSDGVWTRRVTMLR